MTEYRPLAVLVVEDEALVAMQLQMLIEDTGHDVAGWACDLDEARRIVERLRPDLALVDMHLADGPTGAEVAAHLRERDIPVVFMTANAKRVPVGFVGAIGIIAKPYTAASVRSALSYLHSGVRNPPPGGSLPAGLTLSPSFSERWASR